jgi:hypothetical protein
VRTSQELSASGVDAALQAAGTSQPIVTSSTIRSEQSARPRAALSALARPAQSAVLDLVFADFACANATLG